MHKKYSLRRFCIVAILLHLCTGVFAKETPADTAITIGNDIEYNTGLPGKEKNAFVLDMYQPGSNNNIFMPAIIFVHGGGFWEGDKRSGLYVQMATAFAKQGYISFSVNYRLKDQNTPYTRAVLDTCIADVTAAIRWIKTNSRRLRIDTTSLFICGDSAGGGIVINTCYDPLNRQQFKGCIDLWGGLPGKKSWEAPVYDKHFGNTIPPTCIIHGTADRIVPYATSLQLAAKLSAAGVHHQLYALTAADHYPVERAAEYIPVMLAFTGKLLKKGSN